MAGPGAPSAPVACWKRHIVRQLRLRDRTQKALFLELVPAYNRLLQKAELLARVSETLPEPSSVTPATHQGPWEEEEAGPDSGGVPSPAAQRVKWNQEEEGLRLECGEGAPLHSGHPRAGPGHLAEPQPRPAASALLPRRHAQSHRPACQQHPPGVQGRRLQVWFRLDQSCVQPGQKPCGGGFPGWHPLHLGRGHGEAGE
uniref:Autophagy related 16 like 2 n=1 Tax=Catagonus wagneri TaxID=51154 RepID=A0A8C3VML7_9CETA